MFTLEKLFLGKILIVLVKFIFYTIFKNLIFSGVKNFIKITSTLFIGFKNLVRNLIPHNITSFPLHHLISM